MPKTYHKRGNRDRNEKLITKYLRRANVRHQLLPPGAGADILLLIRPMYLIEVKNPDVPKSERGLTETELEVKLHCDEMHIPYHVVETPEEMATIINKWIEEQ